MCSGAVLRDEQPVGHRLHRGGVGIARPAGFINPRRREITSRPIYEAQVQRLAIQRRGRSLCTDGLLQAEWGGALLALIDLAMADLTLHTLRERRLGVILHGETYGAVWGIVQHLEQHSDSSGGVLQWHGRANLPSESGSGKSAYRYGPRILRDLPRHAQAPCAGLAGRASPCYDTGSYVPQATSRVEETQTVRVSVSYFQQHKAQQLPIVMLTAYDATMARLAEQAGIDVLLVGDTLGMVIQGHDTTVPVTLEDMLYHTRLVVRGTERAFVVGDLPFMTYNISAEQALSNAARLLQEAGAQSVKLEGGTGMAPTIRRLVDNGIPVMAHIGLTPQSVHQLGGWRVQGRTRAAAARLLEDAHAVEAAGAYAVVLELVPTELAAVISQRLRIPTIGIGAGPGCDGQVQVMHDLLGLFEAFIPKHTQQYAKLGEATRTAVARYKAEVEQRVFPTTAHAASMDAALLAGL